MRPFLDNRNALGLAFMLPAAALLLVFLTYPLGLGLWLGFTDARIGRPGHWIGIDNFESLFGDSLARLSLFNTLFYTVIASVVKFALGLWLALLLSRHLPFKAFLRAIVLLPFIVPTALAAIAFWWIYDAQFSVVSWLLVKMGLIDTYIDFLGEPWMARFSTIAANVWRGVPFVAICLLAGLQTISPTLYEAAALDGATEWQKFRHVTLPMLTPIIAVVMTFSVLFTFYWMTMTSFKPDAELMSREANPFWIHNPTFAHFEKLLLHTSYPEWMWNTIIVSVVATFTSLAASVFAAYAIERLRFRGAKGTGMAIFLAYLVPPSILFIPLATVVFQMGLFDTRWALILTYPTFLIPFCTWLLMGYFRSIPYELAECALIDGATRWQILTKIILPLAAPGLTFDRTFAV